MRYVTIDDYMRICPEGDATQQNLESAEYDIDSLTFNRIIGQGFDRLAERQKELVTRAVCLQADFLLRIWRVAQQSAHLLCDQRGIHVVG